MYLNLDRRTPVCLFNHVLVFTQYKRSEWFRKILFFTSLRGSGDVLKEMVQALAVCLSGYGCTWEVRISLEKLEKYSALFCATQTLLSCTANFPHALISQ